MVFKWRILLFSIFAVCLIATGCSKSQPENAVQPASDNNQKLTSIAIGFQKYGLLPIVKAKGDLDQKLAQQGISVRWVEFPAGPQLLEGLNIGSVVLGESGEAPPIFAQAASPNLVYVANQPPAPAAEAILVAKDSAIQTVAELKGKRVALNKGSNVHYLLLKQLEKNGLSLSDLDVVYLAPADARAAFERKAVDAWVIWDPFYAAASDQIQARSLANGQDVVQNYQFYLADRNFAQQHPEVLKLIVAQLNQTTEWVKTHQDDAAKLLQQPTGLDLQILKTSISRMGFGVTALNDKVIAEQQAVADAFHQQKLIPNAIRIQDAIITVQ